MNYLATFCYLPTMSTDTMQNPVSIILLGSAVLSFLANLARMDDQKYKSGRKYLILHVLVLR